MQRPFILLAAVLQLGVTGRHASPVPVAVLNNRATDAPTSEFVIIR